MSVRTLRHRGAARLLTAIGRAAATATPSQTPSVCIGIDRHANGGAVRSSATGLTMRLRRRLLYAALSGALAVLAVSATPGAVALADPNCTIYNGFAVCGAIRDKYLALGGPGGFLGVPVTDELPTPDGVGRFNHFRSAGSTIADGSIYWTPGGGAWSIHGAIRVKWASMGWERNLGYPVTDETGTPDGVGRFNHFSSTGNSTFADGSIYSTPATA